MTLASLLQDKASQRKQDLEDSLQAQQYFADANEGESWMREKEPLAANTDYGKDEDTAEALLKKHEAFMADLEAYRAVVEGLQEQSQACKVNPLCLETTTIKWEMFASVLILPLH